MRKFLVVIFLLNITGLFSQDLNEVIDSFKIPANWEKSINLDTSSFHTFYNDGKIARITLTSDFRRFEIIIFKRWVLENDEFIEADMEYSESSSCRNFNSHHRYRIRSFTTSRFYITPLLCPKCDFIRDRRCKKIEKFYSKWNAKWFNF